MGQAQEQKSSERECLNILWVCMDHLVMFAHLNEKVVPTSRHTPTTSCHHHACKLLLVG